LPFSQGLHTTLQGLGQLKIEGLCPNLVLLL
jgi:hypothetical protein